MPKEKSLLNKTSTKSKKRDKYSENKKQTRSEYIFDLHEKLIYLGGLYEDKNGKECIVISRSQNKNGRQYYKVSFSDNLIIESIEDVLKKQTETMIKKDDEDIIG
jgi:hypothetical protein